MKDIILGVVLAGVLFGALIYVWSFISPIITKIMKMICFDDLEIGVEVPSE